MFRARRTEIAVPARGDEAAHAARKPIVRALALAPALAIALALALAAGLPAVPAQAADDPAVQRNGIFNSVEVRSSNLAPFRKWQAAVQRAHSEALHEATSGGGSNGPLFVRLRGQAPRQQLEAVNAEMNTRAYVTDPVNWGVEDYWESPGEFLARFGDCEDYAIAKYYALKRLGWTDEELRVVAVMDTNLRVGHAVLVAFVGGESLLLDNQIGEVIATSRVRHYQPVYSINESSWWRHWPQMR